MERKEEGDQVATSLSFFVSASLHLKILLRRKLTENKKTG